MARPVVKWILAPILQPLIILATILTKRFSASLTAIGINPGPSEHAASKIDAVKNIGLWHGNRFNTQRRQRLETRPAAAELPHFNVVRKIMVSVFPSVFDALVVQDLRIVIEADAGAFVIIDQPTLATDALDKPNRGGVAYAKVPSRMDTDVLVNLDWAQAALR